MDSGALMHTTTTTDPTLAGLWPCHNELNGHLVPCDACRTFRSNPDRYAYTGAIIKEAQPGGHAGLTRAIRHPAIVTHHDRRRTHVVPLTSKPTRRNGTHRIPIPNPETVGLNRQSYLYRHITIPLSNIDLDLDLEIGGADTDLVDILIAHVRLPPDVQQALRATVCADR